MDPELLKILRESLPVGATMEISKRSNVSKQWVSLVLNGVHWNVKVIEAAVEVLEEHKAKIAALKERILA